MFTLCTLLLLKPVGVIITFIQISKGDTMGFYQQVLCNRCNQIWSAVPEDYPALRDEEFFICTCGESLFRKSELYDEEISLLQPAR